MIALENISYVNEPELVHILLEKSQRGKNRRYFYEASFQTLVMAMNSVDSEQNWTKEHPTTTKTDKKIWFRCNKSKALGKQCAAAVVIILPHHQLTCEIHRTNCKYLT